jgi:hypothetical protein
MVVGGAWTDDPLAQKFFSNPFGTRNAVLVAGLAENETRRIGCCRC